MEIMKVGGKVVFEARERKGPGEKKRKEAALN